MQYSVLVAVQVQYCTTRSVLKYKSVTKYGTQSTTTDVTLVMALSTSHSHTKKQERFKASFQQRAFSANEHLSYTRIYCRYDMLVPSNPGP